MWSKQARTARLRERRPCTRVRGWLWALGSLGVLGVCACGAGSRTRGYPLHGDSKAPLSSVARLHGYVEEVDGGNVTQRGHLFELLPGCHVIGTPRTWGGAGADAWVTAETGHLRFVIRMLAGHDYEVRVLVLDTVNRIEIETVEKHPSGEVVAKHLPVADPNASCSDGAPAAR